MSKARLVITAVELEGRSPGEVAASYGLSRSWVYELLARYRAEGDAALEPRSRRPRTNPRATPPPVVELVLRLRRELSESGLDAGPHTLAWHLRTHHDITVSVSTIWRILHRAALITPQPQKRPRNSYQRFEATLPNETWQTDFTHVSLADGTDTEVLTFLDDHSRYVLACTAQRAVTTTLVITAFRQAVTAHGIPAIRALRQRHGLHRPPLRRQGRTQQVPERARPTRHHAEELPTQPPPDLRQSRTRPADPQEVAQHPTTSGDHRRAPDPARHLGRALQHRPPTPIPGGRTPAQAYQARPKATPTRSNHGSHYRQRYDQVDKTGSVTLRHDSRLHHIGIGRAHAGTRVIMLIHDLDIRVIDALTGELLRALTLDPTRDYQPQKREDTPDP